MNGEIFHLPRLLWPQQRDRMKWERAELTCSAHVMQREREVRTGALWLAGTRIRLQFPGFCSHWTTLLFISPTSLNILPKYCFVWPLFSIRNYVNYFFFFLWSEQMIFDIIYLHEHVLLTTLCIQQCRGIWCWLVIVIDIYGSLLVNDLVVKPVYQQTALKHKTLWRSRSCIVYTQSMMCR